jgi:hypothetical protein
MVFVQLYSTTASATHVINLLGKFKVRIVDVQYIDNKSAKYMIKLQSSVLNFRNSTTNSYYFVNSPDHLVIQSGIAPEIEAMVNNVIDIQLTQANGSPVAGFTSYVISLDFEPIDIHPSEKLMYSIQDYRA